MTNNITVHSKPTIKYYRWINEIAMLITLLVLIGVFSETAPNFFSARNLINILNLLSYVGIVAMPMTFVIIAGEIDISVGPAVAFAGVLFATLVAQYHWPLFAAGLATLVVGAGIGLAAGALRVRFNLPSLITTLALWSSLRGAALWWTGALPVMVPDADFNSFFGGDLWGLPVVTWIMLLVFLVFLWLSHYSAFGRSVYAVGGNASAAKLSGVNVGLVRIGVLMGTGLFSAVVGILTAARLGSGNAGAADGMEFDVIAAVVVGGTLLSGGSGRMVGTLLGVVVIATLGNGLVLLGVDPNVQKVIRGAVILVAVLVSSAVGRQYSSR